MIFPVSMFKLRFSIFLAMCCRTSENYLIASSLIFLFYKMVGDNAGLWETSPFTSHLNSHDKLPILLLHDLLLHMCQMTPHSKDCLGQFCLFLLVLEFLMVYQLSQGEKQMSWSDQQIRVHISHGLTYGVRARLPAVKSFLSGFALVWPGYVNLCRTFLSHKNEKYPPCEESINYCVQCP